VFRLAVAAVLGAVTVIWLMAPRFLYPRFFLWLSPAVAVAVAIAVARRPILVALVLVLVGLQVHTVWPRLTSDPYPNRQAARIFDAVRAHGGIPCAIDSYTGQRMIGYTTQFAIPRSFEQAKQCTVALRIGGPAAQLDGSFDRAFPHHVRLDAETPGVLWSAQPITCWTSNVAGSGCTPARRATTSP
jgi:hypothetical protein